MDWIKADKWKNLVPKTKNVQKGEFLKTRFLSRGRFAAAPVVATFQGHFQIRTIRLFYDKIGITLLGKRIDPSITIKIKSTQLTEN